MKKLYTLVLFFSILLLNVNAFSNSYFLLVKEQGVLDSTKKLSRQPSFKWRDSRLNQPSHLNTRLQLDFVPFKPGSYKLFQTAETTAVSSQANAVNHPPVKPAVSDLKVVSNVKVYPNPVESQLNLSYTVSKDANVTIKIMDVLGNEIATLLSQHMSAGEQTNTFSIASKLNSGFYFIRLVVGNETVIKRISVL